MSGICSAHQHHEPGCPRCEVEVPPEWNEPGDPADLYDCLSCGFTYYYKNIDICPRCCAKGPVMQPSTKQDHDEWVHVTNNARDYTITEVRYAHALLASTERVGELETVLTKILDTDAVRNEDEELDGIAHQVLKGKSK